MATLTIDENPSISDTIVFTLLTPDADGCFVSNPYEVNKVVIYYVERDFVSGNLKQYNNKTYDTEKLRAAEEAEAIACVSPTTNNIAEAKRLRAEAESHVVNSPFYFNESKPVQIIGTDDFPAWLSTDVDNALIDLVTEDENGDPVYGQYTFTWQPQGMREGDYFICWTWTSIEAGDSASTHLRFMLKGDTQVTTSIPTHFTDPEKYTTLLDRYTPEMYKMLIADNDRTPDVMEKFNGAVALGFNTIEDLANQMVDLQDANSIHESLIPYLSKFFNLKLKTNDPTRWRGQIKRAVPLFKMKGTKKALVEAFDHAAMKMVGLTQLWEVISSYTWQEVFVSDGESDDFTLEKVMILPIDYDNFELWIRAVDSDTWTALSSDYVSFDTDDGVTTMTWVGASLSVDPIELIEGDEIRVLYKYNEVPDVTAQGIEEYIRMLPLMDQRDERDQIYPLKNWNVRVIGENDTMFNLVIPNRHPYHDWIVYGKVRTEFPYSENIYNMDEYNGSIRNSQSPCDIDRNFISPCTACISSCYNIDLEIESLSDDRILEAREVLQEFTPFHSVLHTFNFLGSVNEFVLPPVEEVEALVTIITNQSVIAGEGQMWFNRSMKLIDTEGVLRDDLATKTTALAATSGTAYNDSITMFCPNSKLDNIGMSEEGAAMLRIQSPSALAGIYPLIEPRGNTVVIDLTMGVPTPTSEPIDNCNTLWMNDDTLNTCAFNFDINNSVLDGTLCNVSQDNKFVFSDTSKDFGLLGIEAQFDVDQGTATSAWKILITAYDATAYDVLEIYPDGSLLLLDHGSTLPGTTATGVSYSLKNGATTVATGTAGKVTVTPRGRVTALSSSVTPIGNVLMNGKFYFQINNTEYQVISVINNSEFHIGNYTAGANNGINLRIQQKVMEGEIGYLSHRGLKLKMAGNLESSLGIQDGANSLVVVDDGVENDKFKANYIVRIGSDDYFIEEIDGGNPMGYTTFTLSGTNQYWKTIGAGGTAVTVTIYNYAKKEVTIMGQQYDLPEHTFRTLDRNGRSVITREDEDGTVTSLSLPDGNEISDTVHQFEGISFNIEYADGSTEQGEL